MISPEWKRSLRRRAGQHAMCEEKRRSLERMHSTSDAVALFLGSIEWALGEDYPTVDEIRKNFPVKELEEYGIYIDREFHGERFYGRQKYVFLNCRGNICTGLNKEQKLIPSLYFAGGCDLTVSSFEHYFSPVQIPLYVYGSCKVEAEQSQDIVCRINKRNVK